MKVVMTKVPPNLKQVSAGQQVDLPGAELDVLFEAGCEFVDAAVHAAQQKEADANKRTADALKASAERTVKDAVGRAKKRGALKAKDEDAEKDALNKIISLEYKPEAVSLVTASIDELEGEENTVLNNRVTSSSADHAGRIDMGDEGFRETVKAYFHASEPFQKELKNGGIVRASHNNVHKLQDAIKASKHRAIIAKKLNDFVTIKGCDISEQGVLDVVKAGDYADPASNNPLGILNTGLLLQWNLGFLKYQLAMLDDITVDVSGPPVLFNQVVRTRYITIPKVMLKSTSNAWPNAGAPTGTDVDVNVTMNVHAGVPISIMNNILAATPRQLFNEQRAPQLYGLGQYIIAHLIQTMFNGSTRIANDGTTTSTIKYSVLAPDVFSVAGATLATFVADLPEFLDEHQTPGGDEDPTDPNVIRYAWVHGRVYATAAADTNFILNQSIQGIRGQTSDNVLATGRFTRIGNLKFRKSQLVTDQVTITGSGADATTNGITVSPGTFLSSTYVGIAGTRESALFVSRVPLDYTKVLPDIPSTAAIEMVTEPDTGLTFLVVKFLDHAYETANMRVQLMFGDAIGDERRGFYLQRT